MKHFSLREFALLCSPIILIGVGFLGSRVWGRRSNDDSKITLVVSKDVSTRNQSSQGWINFAWQAKVTGGPENYYQFGFYERVVAIGRSGPIAVFPSATATGGQSWSVSTSTTTTSGSLQYSRQLATQADALPLGTTKVEWQGTVVAVPIHTGNTYTQTSRATLQGWAQKPGAALVQKTIALPLTAQQLEPIQSCKLEPVNPHNASLGADTCITLQLRDVHRKYYRRIVASEGKQQRTLSIDAGDSPYFKSEQQSGWGSTQISNLLLKLRDVPASWGTLTYVLDVVYDPAAGSTTGSEECDAATIKKLTAAGWLHYSRRLVIRDKQKKISAPNFPKTPNTQLLGITDKLSPTHWIIEARLRYTGKQSKPDLDSPNGPEFTDGNGQYIDGNGNSYGVRPTQTAGEWVAHIETPRSNLKSIAKGKPITMKLEIADSEAAPLLIEHQFQAPGNPSDKLPSKGN